MTSYIQLLIGPQSQRLLLLCLTSGALSHGSIFSTSADISAWFAVLLTSDRDNVSIRTSDASLSFNFISWKKFHVIERELPPCKSTLLVDMPNLTADLIGSVEYLTHFPAFPAAIPESFTWF